VTSPQNDLIGAMSNQDLLSMTLCGQEINRKDQLDEGLTGLTMMVGQTRLNVAPAPVGWCEEVSWIFC
jgi:hypothetical protein